MCPALTGTMAIEYDFDLEGDVTGIDNARLNSTFLTRCVLRNNVNEGNVTAQKSYAGGIAGLQEMGTVLWNTLPGARDEAFSGKRFF